jgi:hypothetical protein
LSSSKVVEGSLLWSASEVAMARGMHGLRRFVWDSNKE